VLAFSEDYGSGRYPVPGGAAGHPHQRGREPLSVLPQVHERCLRDQQPRCAVRGLETTSIRGTGRAPTSTGWPAQWSDRGIRTVYAAAWTFYSKYSFRLRASSCGLSSQRRLGVCLVHPAATTPPRCGPHPEWRRETASGKDGQVGWRLLDELAEPGRPTARQWTG